MIDMAIAIAFIKQVWNFGLSNNALIFTAEKIYKAPTRAKVKTVLRLNMTIKDGLSKKFVPKIEGSSAKQKKPIKKKLKITAMIKAFQPQGDFSGEE